MAGGFDEKAGGGAQMGVMQGPMVGLQSCAAHMGGGHLFEKPTTSALQSKEHLISISYSKPLI